METHEGSDAAESLRFANNTGSTQCVLVFTCLRLTLLVFPCLCLSSLEDSASQNLEREIVLTVVNEFNVLKYMSDK